MAIALVSGQNATKDLVAATSPQSVVLPNNPAAGNLVVFLFANDNTPHPPGVVVQDANGNTYIPTAKTPFTGASTSVGIYYLANAPANALKTITLSWTSGTVSGDIWALEFSGASTASPFENDATAQPPSGPTYTTPSYTTVNDGDLLVSVASTSGTISGAGSPWTAATGIPTVEGNGSEFFIQTTHGAQAVAYNLSIQAAGVAMIAAFSTVSNAVAAKGGMLPLLGVG